MMSRRRQRIKEYLRLYSGPEIGSNIECRTLNVEHLTSNIARQTLNIEHWMSNIEFRTLNFEHWTSNLKTIWKTPSFLIWCIMYGLQSLVLSSFWWKGWPSIKSNLPLWSWIFKLIIYIKYPPVRYSTCNSYWFLFKSSLKVMFGDPANCKICKDFFFFFFLNVWDSGVPLFHQFIVNNYNFPNIVVIITEKVEGGETCYNHFHCLSVCWICKDFIYFVLNFASTLTNI